MPEILQNVFPAYCSCICNGSAGPLTSSTEWDEGDLARPIDSSHVFGRSDETWGKWDQGTSVLSSRKEFLPNVETIAYCLFLQLDKCILPQRGSIL